jgi:hypothetical protein
MPRAGLAQPALSPDSAPHTKQKLREIDHFVGRFAP